MPPGRPRVAVAMAFIRHYRIPFYERARVLLAERGVDLEVYVGDPTGSRIAHSRDFATLPWFVPVPNRILRVLGKELWWQPVLGHVRGADLVVVEQASSRLVNYVLLGWQAVGGRGWCPGHGVDFRPGRFSVVGEAVKRWLTTRAHWMVTYNPMTVDIVAGFGFPRARITDVQNAIDTAELAAAVDDIDGASRRALRTELGIGDGPVAVFCGAMHADKRLPYLIAAAELVHRELPDLHLVLVGDGAEATHARDAAARHPWVHWVGQQLGPDRVGYLDLADVQLMPGTVGLAVLDSFVTTTPMVSSASGRHAPEVAYLEDGRNGRFVADGGDPAVYAAAVIELLTDGVLLDRLRAGCREDRERYTIEQMAQRFVDGVVAALAAPVPRGFRRPRA